MFRRAVDLLDAGDAAGLRVYLQEHPGVATQKVTFEPGYFHKPSLQYLSLQHEEPHAQ